MRKIYLLKQSVSEDDYDVYDSMVIIAEDEKEAILLSYEITYKGSWAFEEEDITVQELGYADLEIKESYVVCASYNAG